MASVCRIANACTSGLSVAAEELAGDLPPLGSREPSTLTVGERLRYSGPYFFGDVASRKSFTMGMMAVPFSISVTCVVFGRTANLDSERGRKSP